MTSGPIFGVIMAGGSGTRLWPQSRKKTPKHLLKLVGDKTMLQITFERIAPTIDPSRIFVVTLSEQIEAVKETLPEVPPENLIAEPVARNTAPCIGLAATVIQERCPGGVMAVMPADHIVSAEGRFSQVIEQAALIIDERPEALVTIGISPTRPATGFGYIKKGRPFELPGQDSLACFEAAGFVEKPILPKAERMVAEGSFLWNAGVFFWRADTILGNLKRFLPDISSGLETAGLALGAADFDEILADVYEKMIPVSIDYGVMQKADSVMVIVGNLKWDDIGSWASLANIWELDESGCASNCELIGVDSRNSVAFSDDRLIVIIGVDDVVIVDSDDAVLVCKRDRAEDVRKVVEEIESRGLTHLL